MEEQVAEIKKEAEDLLKLLNVEDEVSLTQDEDGYHVTVDSEENALLIGKHGNTLSSLEHILALIVARKTGEYKRILLEIGTYRKEREEYLKDLALRLKQEVVDSGEEKSIRGLKSWERRLVHLMLQDDEEVATRSEGEGRDRVLLMAKK